MQQCVKKILLNKAWLSLLYVDCELVIVLAWIYVSLPSVCSAPHPHDTDGFITLELNSLGLYPVEVPLLLSIQRARVMDWVVTEHGEHSAAQLKGRVRVVAELVAEETRTAAPAARTMHFSMAGWDEMRIELN